MKSFPLRLSLTSAVVAAALVLANASFATASVAQPSHSVGVAVDEALPSSVANAHFLNQYGQAETLASLKGKTVVIVPLLTLCGDTCPFTTGNLLQVQQRLATAHVSNVEIVTISIDPYRDTVARMAAYATIVGDEKNSNFQLWTEAGTTTTPHPPTSSTGATGSMGSMGSSSGSGNTNSNLTAVAKFLGWSIQVVAAMKPVMVDWMTGKKLTYDMNHSDGFWVLDANQHVRFASGTAPAFTGTIAKKLATFMGSSTNIYKKATPDAAGWTPAQVVQAVEWVKQGN